MEKLKKKKKKLKKKKIEEEGTHPYHEEYVEEGIIREWK